MNLDEILKVSRKIAINHVVFEKIEKINEVYSALSDSCLSQMEVGTSQQFNYHSYLFSTMESTLEALSLLLKNEYVNDAFTLLRKYIDLTSINFYFLVKTDKEQNVEGSIIQEIDDWVKGINTLDKMSKLQEYISENFHYPQLEGFFDDGQLKIIRETANDFTHYNTFEKAIAGDSRLYTKNRREYYDEMLSIIEIVFVRHFAVLSLLRPYYFRSSEYTDHLEMGLEPPEGSQTWVMTTITQTYKWIREEYSSELYEFLSSNTDMDV